MIANITILHRSRYRLSTTTTNPHISSIRHFSGQKPTKPGATQTKQQPPTKLRRYDAIWPTANTGGNIFIKINKRIINKLSLKYARHVTVAIFPRLKHTHTLRRQIYGMFVCAFVIFPSSVPRYVPRYERRKLENYY